MCPNRQWFENMHTIPTQEIRLGDKSVVKSEAVGDIIMSMPYHTGNTITLTIGNVLYVPELGLNILSCSRLAAKGISTVFHDRGWDLIDRNDDDDVIFTAVLRDELYWILHITPEIAQDYMQHAGIKNMNVKSWHHRLGHVNKDKIASMRRNNQLPSIRNKFHSDPCLDCSSGKQTRGPFKGHIYKATKPGEVSHSDVVGPLSKSFSECKYFVSFIDEWTRYTTVMPIMRKSDVHKCFKEFRISFKKMYETTVKSILFNNGGEYTPKEKYAKKKGIQVTRAAPYTPEANGISERMSRTLVQAVRTMLAQSGPAARFWVEAIRNAVKIRNLIPRDNGVAPYQELTGKTTDIRAFRPFGCLGKVHSYRKGSQN
jgi:hypothetical protein